MFKFVSWPQIVAWLNSLQIMGAVTVLKQVEHGACMAITVNKNGRIVRSVYMEMSK